MTPAGFRLMKISWYLFVIFLIASVGVIVSNDINSKNVTFDVDELGSSTLAIGTAPRLEREFKIGITGKINTFFTEEGFLALQSGIFRALRE